MEKIIEIEHLSKIYKLYNKPIDRLVESLGLNKGKKYKEFYALNDISFSLQKGEILGIIGKNGSGKSTLLKILTGVLTESSGKKNINGKVSALLELGAGFNPEYTGLENIYLNASMMQISKEEINAKLEDILSFADIGDHIYQPVKTYSSGMFVRLAFALSINVNPDILIIDEALAVGDVRFQLKCMDKFLEFVKEGKTILFVSHDINCVKRFCTRTLWIDSGKVIEDGNTDLVTDHYLDYIKSDRTIDEYLSNNSNNIEVPKDEEIDYDTIDIVSISNFTMVNQSNIQINDIKFGEKITLKIEYIVKDETIEAPLLGVAIRSIDNKYICGINTKLDGKIISWKKGRNEIELTYTSFNLIGGEYYFDVGIFDKTGIVNLDYKTKIKSFFVKMDYIAEGIVVLDHSWIIK
ncbi:MAG: ABC transporter ATP-binding protein [Bacilli bacterium]|nr:ABC transporter ATP-binding protein [Bacilli bacterium]